MGSNPDGGEKFFFRDYTDLSFFYGRNSFFSVFTPNKFHLCIFKRKSAFFESAVL